MSRAQLALNVDDLAAAVDFYSKLFDTAPTKLRPGYADAPEPSDVRCAGATEVAVAGASPGCC